MHPQTRWGGFPGAGSDIIGPAKFTRQGKFLASQFYTQILFTPHPGIWKRRLHVDMKNEGGGGPGAMVLKPLQGGSPIAAGGLGATMFHNWDGATFTSTAQSWGSGQIPLAPAIGDLQQSFTLDITGPKRGGTPFATPGTYAISGYGMIGGINLAQHWYLMFAGSIAFSGGLMDGVLFDSVTQAPQSDESWWALEEFVM